MPRSKIDRQRASDLVQMTIEQLKEYATHCERMEFTVKPKKARHAWRLIKELVIQELKQRGERTDSIS